MSVKTVSKLVAKIGFDTDLSGLNKFNSSIDGVVKKLAKFSIGVIAASGALAKFIEKQGQSATKSQVQSAYYDIQQKQLLGLSDAYKAVGGSISTHLGALKQFQDIQGNLLIGQVNTRGIQALAVSGSSSLINTMLYGSQSAFEQGVAKRYDTLRSQHTKFADKQANLLRQNFGQQINDAHQRQILERASGLSYQGAIAQSNQLKYGTSSDSGIKNVQAQLQAFSYKMGMIGTGLEGIFLRIGVGFSKAFNSDDLQEFITEFKNFAPTAQIIGSVLGDVFSGMAEVFKGVLYALKEVFGVINTQSPAVKVALEVVGGALAVAFGAGAVLKLGAFALRLTGILKILRLMKGAAGGLGGNIGKDAAKDVLRSGKGGGIASKLSKAGGAVGAIGAGVAGAVALAGAGVAYTGYEALYNKSPLNENASKQASFGTGFQDLGDNNTTTNTTTVNHTHNYNITSTDPHQAAQEVNQAQTNHAFNASDNTRAN